jgi:lysine 2,3-aminomutase
MKHSQYKESCLDKEGSKDWKDWHWQLKNAIRGISELNDVLSTFTTLRAASSPLVEEIAKEEFSFKVTPHMILALKHALTQEKEGVWEAFLRSFVPLEDENARLENGDGLDCIGENLPEANPVPAVSTFYKDRALFRITSMCAAYCRYCFRRRMIGDGEGAWNEEEIRKGIEYIRDHPKFHEVILSGGDPLILSDERLAHLIQALKEVQHVRRLRIDTKVLTMLPQRITENLVKLLRNNQPFYLIGHFTHPSELTEDTRDACRRLADAGVPLRAHTPLLRGINDDEKVLVNLMEDLVDCRVQPYYLIQFIPTKWTEHFRVPIARGRELAKHLQKTCGGLANPTYIVYLPGASGKVPVTDQYLLRREREGYLFENHQGRQIMYSEPSEPASKIRQIKSHG